MFRFVLACSQTLYFLFKVHRARVIKNKNRGGFTERQRKGLGVRNYRRRKFFIFLSCAPRSFSLAGVLEKKEKKNKTTSVYRLVLICSAVN